jgi:hypothetical protein
MTSTDSAETSLKKIAFEIQEGKEALDFHGDKIATEIHIAARNVAASVSSTLVTLFVVFQVIEHWHQIIGWFR